MCCAVRWAEAAACCCRHPYICIAADPLLPQPQRKVGPEELAAWEAEQRRVADEEMAQMEEEAKMEAQLRAEEEVCVCACVYVCRYYREAD